MAGIVLRKTGMVLLTILKWILQAALAALKLVLGIAKLFLLLLALWQAFRQADDEGGGKYVDAEILQGICKEQETEKNACILGKNEVVFTGGNNAQNTGQT